jgi:hypothetical protein
MTLNFRTSAVCVALCAIAISGKSAAESLHNQPIGTVVHDVAELGERQIPLPPGDWTLVAKQVRQSPNTDVTVPSVRLADVYPLTCAINMDDYNKLFDAVAWTVPSSDGLKGFLKAKAAMTPQIEKLISEYARYEQTKNLADPSLLSGG